MRNKDITLYLTYYSHCMTLHPRVKRHSQYSFCPHMGGTMNRLFYLACCIFALISINLLATNHMDLMLSIRGAHESSMLFSKMTVIDFNADGYDDLVMPQNRSTALSVYAKLYCYFGGPDFDDIPDLEYQGEFWDQGPGARLMSGDFNGDSYGDLLDSVPIDSTNSQMGLRFYYGGPGADLVPDHIIPMASLGTQFSSEFVIKENIGDINNDGCDDIGAFHITPDTLQTWSFAVIFGGGYQSAIVVDNIIRGSVLSITYTGDVNGDSIDDFAIGYSPLFNPGDHYLRQYFGNDAYFDPNDYVVVYDGDSEPENDYPFSYGIGDFNNDGFDDNLGIRVVSSSDWSFEIKLGSGTFPQSTELNVDMSPWTQLINVEDREVNFGDFNGDGYSDMVCSDHISGYWNGAAGIWLGGANPNARYDLRITPPPTTQMYQFGWGTPAVGDFNADGYDDVAFCAPQSDHGTTNYRGWVHIYAGNVQLADTTVANEDGLAPQLQDQWQFSSFPNPLPAGKSLSLRYLGKGYAQPMTKNITVYNLKGQRVFQTQDSSRRETSSISLPELPSGVYILSISEGNTRLGSKRILVY